MPQAREIECAVLGNDAPEASVPGEIIPSREFYDYEDKYLLDRAQTRVPADLPPAAALPRLLHPSIERDDDGFLGPLNQQRSAVGLPAVGLFALEAVGDLLAEHAVLVINSIAEAGHIQSGQRLQEACRQTPQAAIAQPGIGLAFQHRLQAHAEVGQYAVEHLVQPHVADGVAQEAPHQELHR